MRFYNFLNENKGHDFEVALAAAIQEAKPNWKVNVTGQTSLSDIVCVTENSTKFYIEVKLSHKDQFGGNATWQFDGKSWTTGSKLKAMHQIVNWLNKDAKDFIKEYQEFTKSVKVKIGPGYMDDFEEFLEARGSKQIITFNNVDVLPIVVENYKQKNCYYVQVGKDFYRFSNEGPNVFKDNIPVLRSGEGHVTLRYDKSIRQIRSEMKIHKFDPDSSKFSWIKKDNKKVPE